MARPATTTTTVTTAVPALSLEATTATTTTTAPEPPVTDAPTTTVPLPSGTLTLSPTAGPAGGFVTAVGDGCVQNGSGTGLDYRLQYYDPSGALFSGDGGTVMADGTWSQSTSVSKVGVPGRYRIHAQCLDAAFKAIFDYPDAYYDATG